MTPEKQQVEKDREPLTISLAEWDEKYRRRTLQFQSIARSIADKAQRLSPEGQGFLIDRLKMLEAICKLKAGTIHKKQSNDQPMAVDLAAIDQKHSVDYKTLDESGTRNHNTQTLAAADALLKALTPGMNLNLTGNPRPIIKQALDLSIDGLAKIRVNRGRELIFPTVINGIVILYHFNSIKPTPRFVEIRTAITV
ncbi:MAG: hypothetical protein Q8P25_03190 [Candidatus Curtissbacteria bacterium]|nr:hypothetical protein [Candidatus Curtissbacteria bacterium]MDZ4209617.1 hypothetical protein [Candidatus Curtissbacteria bacterium]